MTMTAEAPAAQTTTEPTAPTRQTADDRANALLERLNSDGGASEPAAETPEAAPLQSGEGASPSAAASDASGAKSASPANDNASDQAAKARAERLSRINAVREREAERERERESRRQTQSREKERDAEIDSLRAKLKDLEPLNDVFASEEALLEAAERKGMSAEKLVQWMRTRLTDPNAVAAQKTQTVEQKLLAEIARMKKEFSDQIAEITGTRHAEREEQSRIEAARTFIAQASEAGAHPRTAAMLAKHGPQGFLAWVNHAVVPMLHEGYTLEELHDHVEQYLDEVHTDPAAKASAPANGASQPPTKSGAVQPVTTLGNAVTTERMTVTEDIPLHKLSLTERVDRLKAKLDRE